MIDDGPYDTLMKEFNDYISEKGFLNILAFLDDTTAQLQIDSNG